MPVPIACSGCGKKLRVPESMFGRRVKCPECGVSFEAVDPNAAAPPAEQDPFASFGASESNAFEELDHESSDKTPVPGDRSTWKLVNIGLLLMLIPAYLSIVVMLLSLGFMGALALRSPLLSFICGGLMMVLGGIGTLCHFIGLGLCIAVPGDRGAKAFAITALISEFIALLFICPGGIIPLLNYLLIPASALIWLIAVYLLLFFLRSCSLTLNDPPLARRCVHLMVSLVVILSLPCGLVAFLIIGLLIAGQSDSMQEMLRKYQEQFAAGLQSYTFFGAATVEGLAFVWSILFITTVAKVRTAVIRQMARAR